MLVSARRSVIVAGALLAGLAADPGLLGRAVAAPAKAAAPGNAAQQFDAARRAIVDLMSSFPKRYPRGSEHLRRLDALAKQMAAAKPADAAARAAIAREALAAGNEALLANPLLDFEKLLLIRRRANNLALPTNWQSNSSLRATGYDNEIAVMSPARPGGKLTTLFKPDGGKFVGDVDLHFDAGKMLFSMPGANKRWQICEVKADGTGLREFPLILAGDVDNYDACYLPDGNVIFTSTAPMVGVPCVKGADHVSNLYHFNSRTGVVRQLSFDQDHNWCPTVTNSGRVLYLRWEYSDVPHYVARMLFQMNPDGTSQRAHYGSNSYWPNSMFYARPIPGDDTKFVAVISGHHDTRRMGELVLFDVSRGRREANGVVQRIPGYGKPVAPVILDGLVKRSWPKFLHPWPLSDKHFIVSCKPTPKSHWGIYLADVFDNLVLLAEQDGYALLEPIPFRPRRRPPVVASQVDPKRKDATIYLADVYEGPGLAGVPRGTVRKLRLFTYHFCYRGMGGQVNRVGMDGPWDIKRVLGTVPVEPDGSAFFGVPANTPISIQPLDAEGKAMQLMRSWTTAMPGESQSCTGCHEHPNAVVPGRATVAGRRGPSGITPFYGPTRGFSFKREVQPVLDRYCAGCHGPKGKAAPDFTARPDVPAAIPNNAYKTGSKFPPSYLALRRYVRGHTIESDMHLLEPLEFHADTTRLVQLLEAGHYNVKLDREGWDRLITWIDLNTPAHGTWAEIVGDRKVTAQRDRRRELMTLYAGRDENPEAIPPAAATVAPVAPDPLPPPPAEEVSCPNWPFDADEAARRQRHPGAEPWRVALGDDIALQLVRIPAGEFVMGAADGRPNEPPRKRVRIERGFWMGTYEVTNAQYARFDPAHDSRLEHGDFLQFSVRERGYPVNGPTQPVVRVSWEQAMAFCRWLSGRTGKRFTLPTEAQWEYACRAGTATDMWYGDCSAGFAATANLADATLQRMDRLGWGLPVGAVPPWRPAVVTVNDKHRVSAPVGSYKPNAWGLHDMHGNAAEWTRSACAPPPYAADDGSENPQADPRRVVRGGSWYDRPRRAGSAFRTGYRPFQSVYDVGFRVVCADAGR